MTRPVLLDAARPLDVFAYIARMRLRAVEPITRRGPGRRDPRGWGSASWAERHYGRYLLEFLARGSA
jgi:hypothetical protein